LDSGEEADDNESDGGAQYEKSFADDSMQFMEGVSSDSLLSRKKHFTGNKQKYGDLRRKSPSRVIIGCVAGACVIDTKTKLPLLSMLLTNEGLWGHSIMFLLFPLQLIVICLFTLECSPNVPLSLFRHSSVSRSMVKWFGGFFREAFCCAVEGCTGRSGRTVLALLNDNHVFFVTFTTRRISDA
jgi:hypothetical protein